MTPAPFTHAAYREMLRLGKVMQYDFIGFGELAAARGSSGLACLLRHDCDNDIVAAARLAEIETDEGVRSTYFVMLRSAMYNLLAPTNRRLVQSVLDMGHWLGLHFDEVDFRDRSDAQVAALVDRERALLQQEFGHPIEAVSFHQPSARILDNRVRLTCLNTYDRNDMADTFYSSDSNLVFRGGNPSTLFRDRSHRILHLLLHPEWWTAAAMPPTDKWDRMLTDNFELMQESLLHREDTYAERRQISLTRGRKS